VFLLRHSFNSSRTPEPHHTPSTPAPSLCELYLMFSSSSDTQPPFSRSVQRRYSQNLYSKPFRDTLNLLVNNLRSSTFLSTFHNPPWTSTVPLSSQCSGEPVRLRWLFIKITKFTFLRLWTLTRMFHDFSTEMPIMNGQFFLHQQSRLNIRTVTIAISAETASKCLKYKSQCPIWTPK